MHGRTMLILDGATTSKAREGDDGVSCWADNVESELGDDVRSGRGDRHRDSGNPRRGCKRVVDVGGAGW